MKAIDKFTKIGKFIVGKFWLLGLLLFLYVFISTPISIHNRKMKFKNVSCVTIAYTTGVASGRVRENKYIYYVNGKEYHGQSVSGFNLVKTKDGKYLIKYMCDNPQDALIYFDKPIKGDTIPAEYLK